MNILFIFADQMHRYALGCMDNPHIHTPNLDRLAGEGVLFTDAYSNCPVCTPFRINLFTGQYSSQTDTFKNCDAIPAANRSLARALNEGGYTSSFIGKWHVGDKGNIAVPKELRGDFTDFIGYQCYNGFERDTWFFDENNQKHVFSEHRTDVTTNLAISRLEKVADQNFAMFVAYQAPHYPVQPSKEFEALYRDKTIPARPNRRDYDPYTRTESPPSPQPPGKCPDFQRYGNQPDEYNRLYYAMVSQVDAGVGRLLAALERLGLADNTAVLFTADHGDMQGSHGLKNKCLPWEESSGIPLIVRVPGGASGVVTDALVSGIDFYPACLDYADLPPEPGVAGQSFAPLTRGAHQTLAGPVFAEITARKNIHHWRMIRKGPYKMVVEDENMRPSLLFHVKKDPYELENLVNQSAYRDIQEELLRDIRAWQKKYG